MSFTTPEAIAESLEFEKTLNYTDQTPEVSVIVTCFNHSAFIEECLTSIFTQETNFPFEVLIGDDASTDGSIKKIEAVASNYTIPTKIFRWNANSKWLRKGRPTGRLNFIRLYSMASGSFFARCDGDDSWIHPQKLQLQLDCLLKGSYRLVFGQSFRGATRENAKLSAEFKGDFSATDLWSNNFTGYTSSSILWVDKNKNDSIRVMSEQLLLAPYGDWPLQLIALRHGGTGHVMDIPFVFYRSHPGGSFTSSNDASNYLDNYVSVLMNEFFFQSAETYENDFSKFQYNTLLSIFRAELIQNPAGIQNVITKLLGRKRTLLFSLRLLLASSLPRKK